MDDTLCLDFFHQPSCPAQRQYEALRAFFVEGLSQKDAAQRFGYTYDSFRQLVHHFRLACAAGNPPPFSSPTRVDDQQRLPRPPFSPIPPTPPMSGC